MPELPEVEIVRRGLNLETLNQTILGGEVLLARTVAAPMESQAFLAGLKGSAIAQWHRRGKYLLAELVSGTSKSSGDKVQPTGWLGVHLRMTGQLRWLNQRDPLQKHTRVRLFFQGDRELRFIDQRTFGQMWWISPDQRPEQIITTLQLLGPEPFSPEFSIRYLADQLRQGRRPIKSALLDQALVAGIGNIYADEALFLSQIHPQTLGMHLQLPQIQALHAALLSVLEASIRVGGTTFSTFQNLQGVNGNYGGDAKVYGRAGEACDVCKTPIQRLKLAGRSAHFCPQCQPLP